eukprot:gnl/TRDRNA2_/TRDRNA2_169496_c13_seq1.p1 gnl/TRDRNA2_/TRDRNA2_169496_c13~~gnl/TRDRNA2_/TRDRNA2_169496_c13_seq1.p1  ORF type:complete len:448 (+),score=73.63 gnl/TRDRNA2_/TRDRNA2_169496_c13_seq1:1-1344(+)
MKGAIAEGKPLRAVLQGAIASLTPVPGLSDNSRGGGAKRRHLPDVRPHVLSHICVESMGPLDPGNRPVTHGAGDITEAVVRVRLGEGPQTRSCEEQALQTVTLAELQVVAHGAFPGLDATIVENIVLLDEVQEVPCSELSAECRKLLQIVLEEDCVEEAAKEEEQEEEQEEGEDEDDEESEEHGERHEEDGGTFVDHAEHTETDGGPPRKRRKKTSKEKRHIKLTKMMTKHLGVRTSEFPRSAVRYSRAHGLLRKDLKKNDYTDAVIQLDDSAASLEHRRLLVIRRKFSYKELMEMRRKAEDDPGRGPTFVYRAFRDPEKAQEAESGTLQCLQPGPQLRFAIGRFSHPADRLRSRPDLQGPQEMSSTTRAKKMRSSRVQLSAALSSEAPAPAEGRKEAGSTDGQSGESKRMRATCRTCRGKAGICRNPGKEGHLRMRASPSTVVEID